MPFKKNSYAVVFVTLLEGNHFYVTAISISHYYTDGILKENLSSN